MDTIEKKEEPESYLLVVFEQLNSVNLRSMQTKFVSPLQLLALASYLELTAKRQLAIQLDETENMQRQQNLAVPKPNIVLPGGRQ